MSKWNKDDTRQALSILGDVVIGFLDGMEAMEEGSSLPVAVNKVLKKRFRKAAPSPNKKFKVCSLCGGRHIENLDCQGTRTIDTEGFSR